MKKIKSLAVFCGASKGNDEFMDLGKRLGKLLADSNIKLIYGGASVGLMAEVADACLEANGYVLGVMPKKLIEWEVAHDNLSEFISTSDMHERKKILYQKSDAFVALPGGFGTLDELFEILTWKQIGVHQKTIFLLNYQGFHDELIAFLESSSRAGFIKEETLRMLKIVHNENELLQLINA